MKRGFFMNKKLLSGMIGLCLATGTAFAAKGIKASISPAYNLKNGDFSEYVLHDDNVKYSEFHFEEKNLSSIGANLLLGYNFIELQGDFLWGIPKSSGNMYKSSWNYFNPDLKYKYLTYDNSLTSSFDLNAKLIFDIPLFADLLHIRPFANFNFSTYQFTADNYYGSEGISEKYSYDDRTEYTKTYTQGNSSDYNTFTRELYDVSAGLNLTLSLFNKLGLSLEGSVSPYTYSVVQDYHSLLGISYLDIFGNWLKKYSFGAAVEYSFTKFLSVKVYGNYSKLGLMTGKTYTSGSGNKNFTEEKDVFCGTEGRWFDAGVLITLKPFEIF